jgi:Alkaline phosphatase
VAELRYCQPRVNRICATTAISVFKDNLKGMREFKGEKMWSLFSEKEMPYDIDRDTAAIPSLEEMTRTAISKLSQNEKGSF